MKLATPMPDRRWYRNLRAAVEKLGWNCTTTEMADAIDRIRDLGETMQRELDAWSDDIDEVYDKLTEAVFENCPDCDGHGKFIGHRTAPGELLCERCNGEGRVVKDSST